MPDCEHPRGSPVQVIRRCKSGKGGGRYNSTTRAGEKGLRDSCPPTRIDRRQIAVERRIEPACGAECGIGMPTDVCEQASHVAQSCETGRFVGKKRCNPPIEQIAVLDETAKSTPFLTRGDDQRSEERRVGKE